MSVAAENQRGEGGRRDTIMEEWLERVGFRDSTEALMMAARNSSVQDTGR